MKRIVPVTLAAVLACAAVLASVEVNAQARGPRSAPRPPPDKEARLAELDAWLRRLVGQFHVKSSNLWMLMDSPSIEGSAECRAVGAGPGVNCLLSFVHPSGAEYFEVFLYGLDPDNPGIRVTRVLSYGRVRVARSSLNGDTFAFVTECEGMEPSCTEYTRIHAPPGGNPIRMTIESVRTSADTLRYGVVPPPSGRRQYELLRLPQRHADESSAAGPE